MSGQVGDRQSAPSGAGRSRGSHATERPHLRRERGGSPVRYAAIGSLSALALAAIAYVLITALARVAITGDDSLPSGVMDRAALAGDGLARLAANLVANLGACAGVILCGLVLVLAGAAAGIAFHTVKRPRFHQGHDDDATRGLRRVRRKRYRS